MNPIRNPKNADFAMVVMRIDNRPKPHAFTTYPLTGEYAYIGRGPGMYGGTTTARTIGAAVEQSIHLSDNTGDIPYLPNYPDSVAVAVYDLTGIHSDPHSVDESLLNDCGDLCVGIAYAGEFFTAVTT